jgi:hypothetical protein
MSRFDSYRTKSEMAEGEFFFEHRELLAFYDLKQVQESLIAFLQLNHTAEELKAASVNPTQYRKLLSAVLVTLIDRNAITTDLTLNEDAKNDLEGLCRATGIAVDQLTPPPTPAPTAQELLREEVMNDWRTLSMVKIREKKNGNRQYASMLDSMAHAGSLESSVTSYTRAGA